jgi:hypothetical protein
MKNNCSFVLKITGMNPPLRGIVQLGNSNASQMTFRLLRFWNWSFTIIAALVLIALGLGVSGCAAANLYSVNMRYDAAQAVIPAYLKAEEKMRDAIITVAEFTDSRQLDDKKIIGRVTERDDTKVLVFPKYVIPTKAVANGVKEYLKKAGYKVADKNVQWDLKEETVPKGSGKVIISGSIDELEVTCWRGVFSNSYKTKVKLTIVFADLAKGKILYKSKVESSSSRDDVSFSEEQLGERVSTALGDAIEKVFEEKAVAQKIKEAIIQKYG